MKWWAVALLAARVLAAQAVEGTVIGDGRPLAGVKVELAQNGSAMRRAITDAQGVFRFDDVAAGDYALEYTLQGYREVGRPASNARRVHVAAGTNPIRIEARMLHLGRVSGRVIGEGEPMARADVQLLLAGNLIGQIERSDAKGEFEFKDIDPGTYLLSARPTRGAAPPAERDGQKFAWVRTWYPSSADSTGALKVTVAPGTNVGGEEIVLRALPAHRVSGRVLSPTGEGVPGATVKGAPPNEIGSAEFEVETRSQNDGTFEFDALPDGEWRITAEAELEGARHYVGRAETVEGRDLERIDLRFIPPFSLTGKVLRAPTGTPAEKKQIGVTLAPREGGYHIPLGRVEHDGRFQISNITQGVYRVQPTSPGEPYYLASIEMGGRDVLGQWVEIAPGTLPLTITYRGDGGTVRGTVEDCNGATVALAPREPHLQYSAFVRQEKCGPNGRFEIAALRPGEYYAFAFDRPIGMLEYGTFVAQWINRAVRLTVRAGEATDASLRVIERSPY